MLIKTELFDKKFKADTHFITINKNSPLIQRGSYKLKKLNSVVSDIDLAQFVRATDSLLHRLLQIINQTKRSNFIFTKLHCGMYEDFIAPWTVNNRGGCVYNVEKAREWYKALKSKAIMDEESYKKIEAKLFRDDIGIKDLLSIKQIVRPFSEILWNREDIQRGYKVFLGKKYYLLDLIKKGHVTVMRYLYRYGREYVSIDFGLVDKQYIKEPSILHEYYRGDVYKIFKSYKWYLKKEYYEEYVKVMGDLEKYTGLLNRVKLISGAEKHIPQKDIDYLKQDATKYANGIGLSYDSGIEKNLVKKIHEIVEKNRPYFRERIQDRFKQEVLSYELRSEQAKALISQNELEKSNKECPFYTVEEEDFFRLLKLSNRALIEPKRLIDCITTISTTLDIDSSLLVKTIFNKSDLYIRESKGEYTLYEKGKPIEKGGISDLKKLQIKVLM
jgi:hypothetical protein